jgi:carboxyl-terminal processing protease
MNWINKYTGRYLRGTIILFSGIILASYTFCNQETKHQVLIRLIAQALNYYHYSPQTLDDDFSVKVYNQYFKNLDFTKRFFTKADLKEFEDFKTKIDDEIKSGNTQFYTKVSEKYFENVTKIQGYYTEILSKPMEFNTNDTYQTDPDKTDFVEDDAALKEAWKKSIKYQVLTRVNSAAKIQENTKNLPDSARKTFAQMEETARKSVLTFYNNLFRRIKQNKDIDNYAVFINSITSVYDPHTQYMSPQDKESFDIQFSGQLEGIGALLQESESLVKVASIVPGSPSWLQGDLKAGDLILKVAQENKEPVDIFDMPINDVVKMVRGKKGTKVTLTVQKIDKTIKDITITRDVVIIEETYAKSSLIENGNNSNIGYINLPSFYANIERTETGRSSSLDMKNEIEKLKQHNVNGIIIDLRNNGGGSLPEAIKIGGLFIKQGPIVQVKTNMGEPRIHFDPDTSIQYDGPLVILVNSFSASASEILAAAMQDYKRAIIIGSNATFGKGTVQTLVDLDEAVPASYSQYLPLGTFKVTIQKYYRINGGATQLKGVVPDIVVPDIYSDIKIGEREEDYCMPWTQIKPAAYNIWPYSTSYGPIIKNEKTKIEANPDFKIISEEALQIKKQRDESLVSLNYAKFSKEEDGIKNKNKAYDNLLDKENGLNISVLPEDLEKYKNDTTTTNRNNVWIKTLKKDLYLKEAVSVINEMRSAKK